MQILMRRKISVLCLAVMLLLPLRCFAQDESQLQLSEQKIKAGLIYNFLKYTEWPSEKAAAPASPLVVCIFGAGDPLGGYLQPIEDRTVHQRVVKLQHISAVEEAAKCQMLFISEDTATQWPALHSFLAHKSVLTVGDFDGFSKMGGMIEFGTEENRIRILLNMQAVDESRLHIYDNLRRLAKLTHASSAGGDK
jgi:hypothetical protein